MLDISVKFTITHLSSEQEDPQFTGGSERGQGLSVIGLHFRLYLVTDVILYKVTNS